MALFSAEGWLFLLRWFHFLAGITWIGLLYYFNFVQTPFFATAEPPVRTGMLAGSLVGRALWWFRWGAMLTFITGWLYILHMMFHGYGGVSSSRARTVGRSSSAACLAASCGSTSGSSSGRRRRS